MVRYTLGWAKFGHVHEELIRAKTDAPGIWTFQMAPSTEHTLTASLTNFYTTAAACSGPTCQREVRGFVYVGYVVMILPQVHLACSESQRTPTGTLASQPSSSCPLLSGGPTIS